MKSIQGLKEELFLEINEEVKTRIENGEFKNFNDYLIKEGLEKIQKGKIQFHPNFKPYDEKQYLEVNPDIEEAIKQQNFKSGFEHFCLYGYQEIINNKRTYLLFSNVPLIIHNFNEKKYLEANPDVKEAIERGEFKSILEHLKKFGFREIKEGKRRFYPNFNFFNEEKYLEVNPDVKKSISRKEFISGFEHFCLNGYKEIVEGKRKWEIFIEITQNDIKEYFDEDYYDLQLKDKNIEVKNTLDEKIEHFLKIGYYYNLSPCKLFDSEWYQKMFNIDKKEVNPFLHFIKWGVNEYKNPSEEFDIKFYLNEYPDVKELGLNPLLHYIKFGQYENRYKTQKEKNIDKFLKKTESKRIIDLDNIQIPKNDYKMLMYKQKETKLPINIDRNIKLISFDIWDTVLRRNCYPDEIKLNSARFLYINHFNYLKDSYKNLKSLYIARKKAEDSVSLTNDYEYRYKDAIPFWIDNVFKHFISNKEKQKIVDELLENEFLSEDKATRVDINTKKVLEQYFYKEIVYISDFYKSSNFLTKLLASKGVNHYFIKGYSSSDLIKNKRTGELFQHVLKEFDLSPKEMFHIGDNHFADIENAKKLGINCFHYVDENEEKLKEYNKIAFEKYLEEDSEVFEERVLYLAEILSQKTTYSKEKIGFKIAPLFIGYILFIIEEAKKLEVDTIYFFTREGIFLKELYDEITKLNPYNTTYPKSELLEVSRVATFGPSLKDFSQNELMRLWNQYSIQSPKAFAKSLNIDNEEVKELFESYGFSYDEKVVYPWQNEKFMELLDSKEFDKLMEKTLKLQKDYLLKYLEQKGLTKGKKQKLIVDLGWRGTIQDNIAHLLPQKEIYGIYLGLYKFLNEQPKNSKKIGWLFDLNKNLYDKILAEVGPLEMLTNGKGGSTVGYKQAQNEIIALKEIESDEEAVYDNYTYYFQKGIKEALPSLINYISIHALTSSAIKNLAFNIASSIVENPPLEIAEAFFALSHNESFGTGSFEDMSKYLNIYENIKNLNNADLHSYLEEYLSNVRWRQGFVKLLSNSSIKKDIKGNDIYHMPIDLFKSLFLKQTDYKVGFYVPPPLVGSGGHRTIYNLARNFYKMGCKVYIFLEGEGAGIKAVYNYLQESDVYIEIGWNKTIELDLAIATIAHSAEFVHNLQNVKEKAYLVQDFEAWFNPVGDAYTIAENSYTYGLTHFTVGNFLSHVIQTQYKGTAIPAGLGIDTNIYFDKEEERENAIAFLYQPEKPRRNPMLAIKALEIVKEKYPDVKIYLYGSDAKLDLSFEADHLGLIHDLSDLNDLYNKCKVGLCISMSNPSRIPFEFMSSGVVPVDVYRYNNLMDYKDMTIKLAYQSPESLATAIIEVLENEKEYEERKKKGKKFVSSRTLKWETDVFVNASLFLLEYGKIHEKKVKRLYDEEPNISEHDKRKEVEAFCKWQKKLSEIE